MLNIRQIPIYDINKLRDANLNNVTFNNDRYTKISTSVSQEIEVTVTESVTKEDLNKIKSKKRIIETFDHYVKNVLPDIIDQDLTWIDNIISGKKEQETMLYNDDEFVICPDIKWDGVDINSVYLLAIVKNKKLRSLRNINGDNIRLIKKIYNVGAELMQTKFNYSESDFRAYVHYWPSFWQLHVHFNLINRPTTSALIDFAHSVKTIINNVAHNDQYYQMTDLEVLI
jgi:m7GpppX diphosphatase